MSKLRLLLSGAIVVALIYGETSFATASPHVLDRLPRGAGELALFTFEADQYSNVNKLEVAWNLSDRGRRDLYVQSARNR